jgi:hypothetical protein
MKTGIWIFGLLLLGVSHLAAAQGLLGVFQQQANKKKLMVAQVAALMLFDRKHALGYRIREEGLTTARGQKAQEKQAHDAYYKSLSQVSPAVGAQQKKKEMLGIQSRMESAFTSEITWQEKHRQLTQAERTYFRKVAEGLRRQAEADLSEMELVTTPGKVKLTDAERMDRIDRLVAAIQDKYAFALSFTGKCRKLALARLGQQQDQEQLKKLYGN